jgi:hypothetical protein
MSETPTAAPPPPPPCWCGDADAGEHAQTTDHEYTPAQGIESEAHDAW